MEMEVDGVDENEMEMREEEGDEEGMQCVETEIDHG